MRYAVRDQESRTSIWRNAVALLIAVGLFRFEISFQACIDLFKICALRFVEVAQLLLVDCVESVSARLKLLKLV